MNCKELVNVKYTVILLITLISLFSYGQNIKKKQ